MNHPVINNNSPSPPLFTDICADNNASINNSNNTLMNNKKSSQACDHCHKRRIKCSYQINMGKCSNCNKLNKICTFNRVPQKRGPHRKQRKIVIDTDNLLTSANIMTSSSSSSNTIPYLNKSDTTRIINDSIHFLNLYYKYVHNCIAVLPEDDVLCFRERILDYCLNDTVRTIFFKALNKIFNNNNNNSNSSASYRLILIDIIMVDLNKLNMQERILMICSGLLLCFGHLYVENDIEMIWGISIGIYNRVWNGEDGMVEDTVRRIAQKQLLTLKIFEHIKNYKSGITTINSNINKIRIDIGDAKSLAKIGNIYEQGILKCLVDEAEEEEEGEEEENEEERLEIWDQFVKLRRNKRELIELLEDVSNGTAKYDDTNDSKHYCINKICEMINSILKLYETIEYKRASENLAKIILNNEDDEDEDEEGPYEYYFGINVIFNNACMLFSIIQDIPSFFINMLMMDDRSVQYGSKPTDSLRDKLSNSMNELVQITTINNKIVNEGVVTLFKISEGIRYNSNDCENAINDRSMLDMNEYANANINANTHMHSRVSNRDQDNSAYGVRRTLARLQSDLRRLQLGSNPQ